MYTSLRLHGVSWILRAQNLPPEPEWTHSRHNICAQVVPGCVIQNYSYGDLRWTVGRRKLRVERLKLYWLPLAGCEHSWQYLWVGSHVLAPRLHLTQARSERCVMRCWEDSVKLRMSSPSDAKAAGSTMCTGGEHVVIYIMHRPRVGVGSNVDYSGKPAEKYLGVSLCGLLSLHLHILESNISSHQKSTIPL